MDKVESIVEELEILPECQKFLEVFSGVKTDVMVEQMYVIHILIIKDSAGHDRTFDGTEIIIPNESDKLLKKIFFHV